MQAASRTARFLQLLFPQKTWHGCLKRGTQTQTPRLSKALKPKQTFGEGGYILLVVPIATFCLGTWQVKRRWWKLDLIQALEEKTQAAPIPLPHNLEEVSELEYRPVKFRGVFDHSKEMVIGPRSNVLKEGGGLVSAGNQSGVHIVTPMKLSDRDETILVNRGWVPTSQKDPSTRREGQVEGEVEVSGIVRLNEKRPPFMPKGDAKSQGYWLYRDIDAMAKQVGAAPVFVDQDLKTSIPGGPTGGQTRVTLRNEHLSYIITWYSLSAITFAMWFRRYRRPPPPDTAIDYIKKSHGGT